MRRLGEWLTRGFKEQTEAVFNRLLEIKFLYHGARLSSELATLYKSLDSEPEMVLVTEGEVILKEV